MRLGVDAWRLDVANEISDHMLDNIKHVIKDEKKDTYVVGEIWHNATEWISNNGLDGVTNYAVSRAILSFVCDPPMISLSIAVLLMKSSIAIPKSNSNPPCLS